MLKLSNLKDEAICFLLDIEYGGFVYRFSTTPITLINELENSVIPYGGGLIDPTIDQTTSFMGINVEGDTISMDLIFESVDWIAEWKKGRSLDNSPASIYMITMKDGETTYTMRERVGLYTGKIVDAIFGSPNHTRGHIAFSISNDLSVNNIKMIPNYQVLTVDEFPFLDALITGEGSVGKAAPLVFGTPGGWWFGRYNQIETDNTIKTTPAYFIGIDTGTLYLQYIIAYHPVEASQVRIWDSTGGNFVNPVLSAADSFGNIYSYVEYYPGGGNVEDNSFNSSYQDNNQQFWTQWSEWGGAMLNPYGEGLLEGGGDICIFALSQSGLDYDDQAWASVRGVLNQYQFAGFANDTDLTWWEWVQENIIAFLPIEVINGGKGLKPVLNMYFYSQRVIPAHYLNDTGDFEILTALQPLDVDIVNRLRVKYCYEGERDRYKSSFVIDGSQEPIRFQSTLQSTPIAKMSYQKYGYREDEIELPFVYDYETAQRIARDIIRMRGLGAYGLDIQASEKFGYLEVGEVIAITSDRLGLNQHICQIISKSYIDNGWRFTLHLENNNLINFNQ